MDNALVPWFILVPETQQTELIDLNAAEQAVVLREINLIATILKERYAPDKLNIAAIGNIVRQLHVHVVGRFRGDYAWPGVVWGRTDSTPYKSNDVEELKLYLAQRLSGKFAPQGSR